MNIINEVPIWEKYTLSVDEAAIYFRIGKGKLRQLIEADKTAKFLLWNGNRYKLSESYSSSLWTN